MSEIISKFVEYFQYSFVIYAFITGILISLISALLGVILVLKRYSFIGDALSHTAFAALTISTVLKLSNNMLLILPVTVLFSVMIFCSKRSSKFKGEANIAMLSSGTLAFGYLIMNICRPKSNLAGDVCTVLFGSTSILTLTKEDVALSVILSLLIIIFYVFFHNKLFMISFDKDFAASNGNKVFMLELILSIIIAIVISLSMNLVGSLLISALIVFPVMASRNLFKSFNSVVISTCVISVFCALLGLLVSILMGTPVGSTIVMADALFYGVSLILNLIFKRVTL